MGNSTGDEPARVARAIQGGGDGGECHPPHAREWRHLTPEARAAWAGFLRTHARVTTALDADLRRTTGLTLGEFDVLRTLAGGARRMSDLAETVLLSRSGLTRLVQRLESRGLVERTRPPADVRQVYAALTTAGHTALIDAEPAHVRGIRKEFLDRLPERELRALARLWTRWE